ncbi:NAD(P)/FAD-dependent oxidoreductase [Catenovulum sp. 2E275]|uniref:NAD(P)/FAD-dependent oxidoreductase n=1 Tax=Catenovulum sp. 2E275 TaxID=2980497 RepID=UPI0021D057B2|nr:NAD(P)/FAD-dependent oxidoreductase [Catenovulum sp. 2E275]MCU4674153.1 NAD(P)/FAD-dependent oxidoreductase [Catenovulum sp. 2E275]
MNTEVAIIGGSFAGLSAAMQLVRGHRKVVVIDDQKPRNRFASYSHGIFCLDGKSPSEIKETALHQLNQYPTFSLINGRATHVENQAENGFKIFLNNTETPDISNHKSQFSSNAKIVIAQKLILATGLRDELPNIPGVAEHWGQSVVHCPYCHGYELSHRALGVLASNPLSAHQAAMLPDWGVTTLFTQNQFIPDADQLALLTKRGVKIENTPVIKINGNGKDIYSVTLANGTERSIEGLYVAPKIHADNSIVSTLGCELTDSPLGKIIKVDEFKQTSVANVYAAGDNSNPMQNGTFAIASGVMAGVSVHQSLMFG